MSEETRLWWLSFADGRLPTGRQFLGVAIVPGTNVYTASLVARHLGCNPGGEVAGEVFEDDEIIPPGGYRNRLLTSADVDELIAARPIHRGK